MKAILSQARRDMLKQVLEQSHESCDRDLETFEAMCKIVDAAEKLAIQDLQCDADFGGEDAEDPKVASNLDLYEAAWANLHRELGTTTSN